MKPNGKHAMLGAGVALFFIPFLVGAGAPDPAWPGCGMIRPRLFVPVAGALGGAFLHGMAQLRDQFGWNKRLVFTASLRGYPLALWLGTVPGLDGTWWH